MLVPLRTHQIEIPQVGPAYRAIREAAAVESRFEQPELSEADRTDVVHSVVLATLWFLAELPPLQALAFVADAKRERESDEEYAGGYRVLNPTRTRRDLPRDFEWDDKR